MDDLTTTGSGNDQEPTPPSNFSRLHPRVQEWVWRQMWQRLRDIQEQAIPLVLAGEHDILIMAPTSGGKTEAFTLPLCSRMVEDAGGGIRALYLGATKALINDQGERADLLCEHLAIPVHRWHGDVSRSKKMSVLKTPSGILLVTPESLEAIFVRRSAWVPRLFSKLSHIVVDEIHTFAGTERGRQLQSLLHRIECAIGRRVPRIGLSATVGDVHLAAEFLRPGDADRVRIIQGTQGGQEVRIQVRGYRVEAPRPRHAEEGDFTDENDGPDAYDTSGAADEEADGGGFPGSDREIADHLFATLRGKFNLIFPNSRGRVEAFADLLLRISKEHGVPNEFLPHHGNLPKEAREEVEARLKDRSRPTTAIATSTLELGIDIGNMDSIAQIGAPPSVSSLRQRVGRAGRRGKPAVLRAYVQEREITPETPTQDTLRARLVQTIAMIELMKERWYEPPPPAALHLSTLVQQTLSLSAQHSGISEERAWKILCEGGPFRDVDRQLYAAFVAALVQRRMLELGSDGTLLPGEVGEQVLQHFDFYAAFQTPEEYRVVCGGESVAKLPVDFPIVEGMGLILKGQRWRVKSVDDDRRLVVVAPSDGGDPPLFGGAGVDVHDRVRQRMYDILVSADPPPDYLAPMAKELIEEAREGFRRMCLTEESMIEVGTDTLLFLWRGDRVMNTLVARLSARNVEACHDGLAICVTKCSKATLRDHLAALVLEGPGDPTALAATVGNKAIEKWDHCLSEDLLNLNYGRRCLDVQGLHKALVDILGQDPTEPAIG